MWEDFKYAWRLLIKSPSTSLFTVLTLGLGIGTAVYMAGVIHTYWFAGPPWPHANRLFAVVADNGGQTGPGVPYADFVAYQQGQRHFESLEPISLRAITLAGLGYAMSYGGAEVGAGTWRLHGVQPMLGRILNAADALPGAPAAAVISERVWREHWQADPGVIGQQVKVNGLSRTIVGVMPAGFRFPVDQDVWLPFVTADAAKAGRNVLLLGWLKPGADREQAKAELMDIGRRASPDASSAADLVVEPFPWLAALSGMGLATELGKQTGMLLLLVWINACNMLLSHARERRHELAVRTVLGSPRRYLLRYLLCEGLLLAGAAGALGLFLAAWALAATPALVHNPLQQFASWWHFGIGGPELAVALALVALSVLAMQWLPAWQLSRTDLMALLRDGGSELRQAQRSLANRAVSLVQITLSCTLLISALATFYLFLTVRYVDRGAQHDGFAYMQVRAGNGRSTMPTDVLWRKLDTALHGLPGQPPYVLAAKLPGLGIGEPLPILPEGMNAGDDAAPRVGIDVVSPGYFAALGIPILAGRAFGEGDTDASDKVAIVDATFAQRYWPGQSAVGKTLRDVSTGQAFSVVGLCQRVQMTEIPESPDQRMPLIYYATAQMASAQQDVLLGGPGSLPERIGLMRLALAQADPNLAPVLAASYGEMLDAQNGGGIYAAWECWLSAMAVLMIVTGLYAIHARAVAQQARDIQVRRVLGASDGRVAWHLLARNARLLLPGVAIGAALGWMYAVYMHQLGYPVTPLAMAACTLGAAVIESAVVVLAVAIPARCVLAFHPGVALRYA